MTPRCSFPIRVAVIAIAVLLAGSAVGQTSSATVEQAIESLPADLKEHARTLHAATNLIPPYPITTAGQKLSEALLALRLRDESVPFLLAELQDESQSMEKRRALASVLDSSEALMRDPRTLGVFLRLAAHADANAQSIGRLGYAIKTAVTWQELTGLEEQLRQARARGDQVEVAKIMDRQEQMLIRHKEVDLPGFLRKIPPPILVKPNSPSRVRVALMGDFGASDHIDPEMVKVAESFGNRGFEGVARQRKVANAIAKVHRQRRLDFGATLGDNFYELGLDDPQHPRWKSQWEDLYTPLRIRFFATLGNHDWNAGVPAAEMLYTQNSKSWYMPALYYTWIAGPVQFFALETDLLEDGAQKQRAWLAEAIDKSTATWKVVYGHFPIRYQDGDGEDKVSMVTDEGMRKYLLPLLEGRVDAYFAGHHHSHQHLQLTGGVEQFISGGGGYRIYPVGKALLPTVRFAHSGMGFAVADITPGTFTVTYYDDEARQLYRYAFGKKPRHIDLELGLALGREQH